MDGGANSDVLVSDGSSLYIKQIRLTKELERHPKKGRHLFSTSSLLDGEENHRSHWMLGSFDMASIPVAYSWLANLPTGLNGPRKRRSSSVPRPATSGDPTGSDAVVGRKPSPASGLSIDSGLASTGPLGKADHNV